MRIRALTTALALAAGVVGMSAGTADAAYQPFTPSIRCDEATGTISTAATGGRLYGANQPVSLKFQVHYGSSVPTGGTTGRLIPEYRGSTVVQTRSLADGSISATGYSHPWRAADHAFYTETLRVYRLDAGGTTWNFLGEASCTRDTRTVVTLTCDPVARTSAARVTGTRYAAGAAVRVEYRLVRYLQQWSRTARRSSWARSPTRTLLQRGR